MIGSTLSKAVVFLLAIVILRFFLRRQHRPLVPGSVALITGGGSGIGLEFARLFARAGCRVVLVGRHAERLCTAQQACLACGAPSADIVVADLRTPEGTRRVGCVVREQAKVQVLKYVVLNAGAGAILPFATDAHFYSVCEEMMDVNYFANVRLLQELLPLLERTHSTAHPSRVIVVSSLAGMLPSILRSSYTASKHAIQGFINALRGETAVAITLCCPGYVDTDFHRRAQLCNAETGIGKHHRRGVPPDVCAQQCMEGVLRGDVEVLTTRTGKLGYMLRPFFTRLVDAQAKRISMRSLKE